MDFVLQEGFVFYYYPDINYLHIRFKIVYVDNYPLKIDTYSIMKQIIK